MLQTYGHRTIPCFLHRLTGIGVTQWWRELFIFSTGWLELVLQTHDSHKTIPCFHHRLTGLGVTDTRWSQDHSLFSPQVDWTWCYRHTMVTGPFLVFSTGWLELVLQTHCGHRTIPCLPWRLTRVGVPDTWWSQDHSLFSPQADWSLCYRLTGIGVTQTWWSEDHSLFSPQVDWNLCYRDLMVTGPFLVFSTGWLEFTQLVLHLQTCVGHRTDRFLHRLTGIGVTHNGHRTIPCFFRRLTGIGVTDTQWSQDHSLFSPQVDWNWCYRHTMVTGPFLVFSTGWLELVLDTRWSQDHSLFSPQVDWNWCYRHTMVTGPFLVFSTGWLELVLQTQDGHRTIPCFLHRLTGVCVTGWLELVLQRHDGQRTTPCFLHRLTGIGVTETWWSQDHSLFSPQADWNSWCYTYKHALVTGLIIFSTGSLDLVYLTDTWWSQDHSLFSPQVDWNWVLQTHSGHRTIPCLPCRLTGVGVTDTRWPPDHSLFSPQVDWNWCYRDMMVTGPVLAFSTGWLEFTQLVLHLQTCVGHRTDRFLHRFTGIGVPYRHMIITGPFLVFSTGWLELVLQIHIGHRTIPCFLHRLTVYTSVCFETKWPGDFICPTGGVLTNVSVVCMVSSYLLGIVLCLLVRLWAQTGLPVPLECQGKIVSHLCFSTACLTDP